MNIRKAFYLRNTSSQNQSYSKETEMRIHMLILFTHQSKTNTSMRCHCIPILMGTL